MSDDKKREANADALAALAGGIDPTPAQAEQARHSAQADQLQDDAAALAALSGPGADPIASGESDAADAPAGGGMPEPPARPGQPPIAPPESDDAEASFAAAALAASDAGPVDLAAELAAHDGGRADPAVELAVAAGEPAFAGAVASTPEEKRARARRFDSTSRKAHAHQFRRTMIPLLLVTGVILLILGVAAMFMPGGEKPKSDSTQTTEEAKVDLHRTQAKDAGTGIGQFRPLLIIASFIVGPILLLGAWMFYLDVRRSERRAAAERRKVDDDRGGRPAAP